MSPTRFRRLWLLTCLTLLGGLTTMVPVNCVCEADQHFGQAVHPIFVHYHPDGQIHAGSHPLTESAERATDDQVTRVIASEHGSLLAAAFDGSISSRMAAWLSLGLIALLTLHPLNRRAPTGVAVSPLTGPPRRSLFR